MLKGKGILSEFQREFLGVFASLPDNEQFFLTGGTALAEFYLGHRLSYDLDLFTGETGLVLPCSYQIEQAAGKVGMVARAARRFSSYVEFDVSRGENHLKVDLALVSPFRLAAAEKSVLGVMVNDEIDIRADKLLAFYGRSEPRDAIDVYSLMQTTPIERMMEEARQKDSGFDLYWFAIALNNVEKYPDDIRRWPVQMLVDCDPLEIKRTFRSLALDIMKGLEKPS